MSKRDGLSRNDRIRRITSVKPFAVIDNSKESLLNQLLKFPRFIKYYDHTGKHDGYFDELLPHIKELYETGQIKENPFDGDMEPSQALLYTFVEQLHKITEKFNDRWNNYAQWYLSDILNIAPLSGTPQRVWLSFEKDDSSETIILEEGTGFHFKNQEDVTYTFCLSEKLDVHDIGLAGVYSLLFDKDKNILPAGKLDYITSVRVKDLLNDKSSDELMFGGDRNPKYAKALGIIVSSPSLLLREGERCITITFTSENDAWIAELENVINRLENLSKNYNREILLFELFNNIFYITISTSTGWSVIDDYTVKRKKEKLVLKFTLFDNFPETTECAKDIHQFVSKYPSIRIYPNFDAWLYPYSWLEKFLLDKITIETSVENVTNVQIYNELGYIDNAKPFNPFGINSERGAWFVVGCYEMSIKNTLSFDLNIKWQQLPTDEKGLYSYYKEYDNEVDNISFRLEANYLSDYKWQNVPDAKNLFLFSTTSIDKYGNPLPYSALSETSKLQNIMINRMLPSSCDEDEYDYSIKSRSGFVRFVLNSPQIGFGEKRYRQLFTEQIVKNALRKKNNKEINPPISPSIEKVTLNYRSHDVIYLKKGQENNKSDVFQLYPFGLINTSLTEKDIPIPFVYNLDTNANLLICLKNVKGGEIVSFFFNFQPICKEASKLKISQIIWYWGNGYQWSEMDAQSIVLDSTQNLLTSGGLKIKIPDILDTSLFDSNGNLWIRAGIIRGYRRNIPELVSLHINAVELISDSGTDNNTDPQFDISPERKLPGIKSFQQITPFWGGRHKETDMEMQMRISEYITHRGKAVTARDYERITLQIFPEVAKVKFIPNFSYQSDDSKNSVTLAIIPVVDIRNENTARPLAPLSLLLKIERYLKTCASPYVQEINVINPIYEELMVRCDIDFWDEYPIDVSKSKLNKLFNLAIAPWIENNETPRFGHSLNIRKLYNQIAEQDFVKYVNTLSIVRITKKRRTYNLYEYGTDNEMIEPTQSYAIFIPTDTHIIGTGIISEFGINDMSIDKHFVIK